MSRIQSFEQIFDSHLQVLSTTLRPNTVATYRSAAHHFLAYLRTAFPHLRRLSQLRRDPHLVGWFRCLCEQHPPLCNATRTDYLIRLRRLLLDLADSHALPLDLIRSEDFPPRAHYLPKPLSPEDDQRLDQQLRHLDNLESNALRLIRATGIRIGEGIDLPRDCLRQLSEDQWALQVPLGKLHTERWVPVDEQTRRIVARMVALRPLALTSRVERSPGFLLPRYGERAVWYRTLHQALAKAARHAGCTSPVTPHRLRHTFATTMLRLGVSLPALMQLLGHRDITMTLRYVQVTQQDLQREFQRACQAIAKLHPLPKLPLPPLTQTPLRADLPTIRDSVAATRHLLEMFRLQIQDPKVSRKLRRLAQRLINLSHELDDLTPK